LAFGQPHQQDLLDFLMATHTPESAKRLAELLRIDLSPSSNQVKPVVTTTESDVPVVLRV
jgi:hypothetical protein